MLGGVKYPAITSNNYTKEINKLYNNYKIKKNTQTMKEICAPSKFKLQIPQKFVSEYINPNTPYTGLLIYHRIGAGKTCSAVRIGEVWKHERKIIFVSAASLLNNFRKELRSECAGSEYLTDKEKKRLSEIGPTTKTYKDIIKQSDERIDKYYDIYSYNKFIAKIQDNKISFKNKVLIIDEIQNMVSESGTYYRVLYDAIKNAPSDLRIVILSATPIFDKPLEIALTINLLRPPKELPTGTKFNDKFIVAKRKKNGDVSYRVKNMDIFKNYIKGYVSYYRGAPPIAFPTENVKYVRCNMSDFQYKSYMTVFSKEGPFRTGDILNLPNNFFIGSRIISNIAFPNKGTGKDGYDSLKPSTMDDLKEYSIKFYKIINKIRKATGPVFIYSNFKQYGGIKTLIKILEYYGYKDYKNHGQGKKRFAEFSGEQTIEYKEEIRNVFNQKNNTDGSKLKIILGSPAIKEGISFLRVKQVHILEPYWNLQRMMQIIGRAVRFCSHKDLPKDEQIVDIYIYLSVYKDDKFTIDRYIYDMAKKKDKIISPFEKSIKEAAIDCYLNYNGNVYKKDEPLICLKN